jgi:hypothetical protein
MLKTEFQFKENRRRRIDIDTHAPPARQRQRFCRVMMSKEAAAAALWLKAAL